MASNFSFTVRKATKQRKKARVAVIGPAGSGKTWTSLMLAKELGGRTCVMDSEAGTSNIYADAFEDFEFDVINMREESDGVNTFHPERYIAGIKYLEDQGYNNIIIDSMTHAWSGEGGVLELVDKAAKTKFSGNSYYAWAEGTPKHRAFMDAMQGSSCHIIATMRTKIEYAEGTNNGRKTYTKIGTKTIQREETDYEFDFVLRMTVDHTGFVEKSRIGMDGETVRKPDGKFVARVAGLLTGGSETAGEVVATVKADKVYPRTKVGFCDWGKETHGLTAAEIGSKFMDAGVEFDVNKWDELQEVVINGMAAQPA